MTTLLLWHCIGAGVVSVILAGTLGFHASAGFAIGAGLMAADLMVLGLLWNRLLAKKLVALSAGVIVIKYAFLGAIVFAVVTHPGLSTGWFVIGISTMAISGLAYALAIAQRDSSNV